MQSKLRKLPIILFVVIFSQAHGFCFAQGESTEKWSFSAGTGLELLYGTAYEYVYEASTKNKISELDWDIKPLVSVTSVARARFDTNEFSLSCAAGFPGRTGIVTDSDWLNYSLGDTSTKTCFSESDAIAENMIDLCLSWSYYFNVSPALDIKSFVGYRYINIAWSMKGGWYQYADNINNTNPPYDSYTTGTAGTYYGLLTTYEQTYSALVMGLSAKWRMSRYLTAAAGIQAAPVLSATAIDNHVLRGLTFTDTMSGGYLLEPDLALDWSPSSLITVHAHCKYSMIAGLRGDETVTAASNVDSNEGLSAGQSVKYTDTSGAALQAFGFGISAELHL
jgi:outer membrane protease